jgi:hypothetical protein
MESFVVGEERNHPVHGLITIEHFGPALTQITDSGGSTFWVTTVSFLKTAPKPRAKKQKIVRKVECAPDDLLVPLARHDEIVPEVFEDLDNIVFMDSDEIVGTDEEICHDESENVESVMAD